MVMRTGKGCKMYRKIHKGRSIFNRDSPEKSKIRKKSQVFKNEAQIRGDAPPIVAMPG